jgi:hypothetical protein
MYRNRQARLLATSINGPDWKSTPRPPVKFEYLTELHGVRIIMTDHAKSQCKARHGMQLEQMKQFFVDTLPVWGSVPVVEYNQEVFIYSTKWQRGMIVAYRRDFKNDKSSKIALVVVTVYPYGISKPAHADTEVYRG